MSGRRIEFLNREDNWAAVDFIDALLRCTLFCPSEVRIYGLAFYSPRVGLILRSARALIEE
jgi:hypothetical protein